MKSPLLLSAVLLFASQARTQDAVRQSAWQQRVNHTIEVQLNDTLHLLTGVQTVQYINRSPSNLTEIWFHLYANAYRNNRTALAKQQSEGFQNNIFFAKSDARGGYEHVAFKHKGVNLAWKEDARHADMVRVMLNAELRSGDTIELEVPFSIRIPEQFSRFGHDSSGYQITQWFPKPAVFDVNGWNVFPYLDQGEFYYEYGKYDVKITLPSRYILAATGVLQDSSLRRKMNLLAEGGAWQADGMHHTWHFIQDSVHDFAWFCDRHFKARKDKIFLLSGKQVETWVLARKRPSTQSLEYAKQALVYYSKRNGDYPYDYCTVVETALKSGGGMEYPMITNVQSLSQDVIVHEVGHNWYQGVLGSQERRYPWMDEGVNSYFEKETVKFYSRNRKTGRKGFNLLEGGEFMLLSLYNTGEYLPPGLHSEQYGTLKYATSVYGHTPVLLKYLEEYLGREMLDSCTRNYFRLWAYRHPLPGDMRDVFEKTSGKELGWFFEDLMNTRKGTEYAICKIDRKSPEGQTLVTVKNRSKIAAPLQLAVLSGEKPLSTVWQEGFSGKRSFTLEGRGDGVRLDPFGHAPEMRRNNDYSRNSGLLRTWNHVQIKMIGSDFDPMSTRLYVAPVVTAFNRYDGYMPGIALYNSFLPMKRNSFLLMPMFGLQSEQLTGYAQFRKRIPLYHGPFYFTDLGLKTARFGFEPVEGQQNTYNRINPYIEIGLRRPAQKPRQLRWFVLEGTRIFSDRRDYVVFDTASNTNNSFLFPAITDARYARIMYRFQNIGLIKSMNGFVSLEWGGSTRTQGDFVKARGYYSRVIPFRKKNKFFNYSLYGGAMLYEQNSLNTQQVHLINIGGLGGSWDYWFQQTMTNRSATLRNSWNTILPDQGGMRTTAMPELSRNWAGGINLESSLPGPVPINVFFDAGLVSPDAGSSLQGYYVGGINMSSRLFASELFELSIPLLLSNNLQSFYTRNGLNGIGYRITWKINLNFYQTPRIARMALSQ
jgi:hypothetical protein